MPLIIPESTIIRTFVALSLVMACIGTAYAQDVTVPTPPISKNAAPAFLNPNTNAPNPGPAPKVVEIAPTAENAKENCWITVSEKYKLPPYLLFAIGMVESGLNSNARNVNTNGSFDYGYMQINNTWYPTLARYKIYPSDLSSPCVSIHVGAWILASNFHDMGYSWKAIGAYNARNDYKRWLYAQKVYAMHDMLVQWSEAYHKEYLAKMGTSPAYVPKPPGAWVQYANNMAKLYINRGYR